MLFGTNLLLKVIHHGTHGRARGLFDKDGVKDETRTFNLLMPSVVMRAREEVRTGHSVSLNWGLDRLN